MSSPKRWVRASLLTRLSRERKAKSRGHDAASRLNRVGRRLLRKLRASGERQEQEGGRIEPSGSGRSVQLHCHKRKAAFIAAGEPIISVDTKKKDLIGNFKNAGQAWGIESEQVNVIS